MQLSEFKNLWEHAHDSPFEGKLKGVTLVLPGINESCGDQITLYFKLDSQKKIMDASFTHSGCTLSYIGSSVFSEKILGKNFGEIKKWKERDFLKFFDMEVSHARLKCVLLPLDTIRAA